MTPERINELLMQCGGRWLAGYVEDPKTGDSNYTEQKSVDTIEVDILKFVGLVEAQVKAEAFKAGARAMFDAAQMRAANHYHGRPEINKICDAENAYLLETMEDALDEVSPEDMSTWRSLTDMYQQGFTVSKGIAHRSYEKVATVTGEERGYSDWCNVVSFDNNTLYAKGTELFIKVGELP